MQEANISFPRIHDLVVLLDLLLSIETGWEALRSNLHALTGFAVDYRYPGESADEVEANEAFKICQRVRVMTRQALGLE